VGTRYSSMGPVHALSGDAARSPREEELTAQVTTLRKVEAELRSTTRRLAEAEQLARVGSWEWDIPNNRVEWSDQLFRIYGLEPQSITPSYEAFLGYVHPDDREAVDARNHKAFADHQPFEDIKRVVRADGGEILMRTQGEVVCDADGAPIRMIGVCEDVTAEERASRARAELASIVASSGDAIYSVDMRGNVVSWNPAAEQLYGTSAEQMLGRPPADDDVRIALLRVLAGDGVLRFETQQARRGASPVDVALTISPITAVEGAVTGVSVITRDVSERRRLERQLRHLADHDALTGLINRRHFEERLAERVAEAGRYGVTGAVLAIDLDSFKEVNDGHGHGAGDAVIRSIALCLQDRLRETDIIARLGGDEFAVILTHTAPAEARSVASELLEAVRRHAVVIDGRILRTTASIGVALFDADATSGDDVLAAADRAMYAAKDAGRNCVVTEVPAAGGTPRRGRARQLREALEQDRLRLHLQPILELSSGTVTRHEALVRLAGPRGLILPGAFIGVAERIGLIHAVDTWVLRQSIGLLAEHPDLVLEVNVSGRSVGDRSLPALIERELSAHGVEPARLILEITETAAIANMDDALRFADALTSLGCSFALDDFGAGFGSFYYLKHLPVDIVKIDGDFISGPRSQIDELVVQAIVRIAQELGKHTVAEHVQDEETLSALRDWGVDYAQGFQIAHPFPAELLSCGASRASREA